MAELFSNDTVPFWTALAAAAATGTALVTVVYTYLTLRLVRAQAEPKVILYVKHDLDRPSVLMLVVENIGRDIANDVEFVPSRPIPSGAWGISPDDAAASSPMRDGPLVEGIPALGPGDSRTISWGQFGGLSKALGSSPIVVEIRYRHGRRRLIGQTRLEVQSYYGTDASRRPTVAMADYLKDIAGDMRRIANGIDALPARAQREKERADEQRGTDTHMPSA